LIENRQGIQEFQMRNAMQVQASLYINEKEVINHQEAVFFNREK
jgi:hypothetical protein